MKRHGLARFTIETELEIVRLYSQELYSTKQLASLYSSDRPHIHRILTHYATPIRPQSEEVRLYSIDPHVFDVIDNEHAAYWLGFIYADGHCSKNTGSLQINLSSLDLHHLEKMNDFFKSSKSVTLCTGKSQSGTFNQVRLQLTHKHLAHRLTEIGLANGKDFATLLSFMPDNLLRHWVRGLFDGDGHISKKPSFCICAVPDLALWCRSHFHETVGTRPDLKIAKNVKSSVVYYQVGGLYQIGRIYNHLYNDATIFLPRKKDAFECILTRLSQVMT